ncbi:MAG: DNA repair protein RadA [candidate division Zixibacteria bacterium]|nr:DNA repair protein RadA [candidate division Zixibacteria bacterium]
MIAGKKTKTAYFCSQCGAEHLRWQGQCKECAAWNSLVEERLPTKGKSRRAASQVEHVKLSEISDHPIQGYFSGIAELDRVLGGKLLPGMTVLLGGDPGIGKSTLLLQAAEAYSARNLGVLYVTGEESLSQIKMRAARLNVGGKNISVVNATDIEDIIAVIQSSSPAVVLIDSIQTVSSGQFDSPPGTVAQVREAAQQLIRVAKEQNVALIMVGHVTKEGMVAGPKVLEHMVDTVVYFEGDSSHLYRLLRATKNRFGSVDEIGLFEMGPRGLTEVSNPSSFFLSNDASVSRVGTVVTAVCEGNRPLMVEVQALVASANYGSPQRVAGGIDHRKLALLLAILEKRCGYPMATHDVFVSVASGLRINEPAMDLPIMVAIVSSLLNKPVDHRVVVIGEVGLSGEVRGVTLSDRRVSEAAKLGFEQAIIPRANKSQISAGGMRVTEVNEIQQAIDVILG